MYKVIIVDDEKQILDGLLKLIKWSEFDFEVCATARNGLEAIPLIKMHKPDLILTDIRMPKMDGLQMIECIRKSIKKDIEFMILSGFSEFQYAQKAMQYNVRDYILKPFDEAELYAKLIEMKNIISEKEIRNNQKIKSYINNIIAGDQYTGNELVLENEDIYGLRYMAIERYEEIPSLKKNENEEQASDLSRIITDKVGRENMRFVFKRDKNKCHMVIGSSLLSISEYDAKHLASTLFDFLINRKNCKVNIFVGKKVPSFKNLHESIQSINKCKNESFYQKSASVIIYDEIRDKQYCNLYDDNGAVINIISSFRKNEMEKLKKSINELINHFCKLRVAPEIVIIHLDRILAYIIQIISERTDNTEEVLQLYSQYKNVQDKQNLHSLAKLVIEFCLFCSEFSINSVVGNNTDIVEKVAKYVDNNFMEHLKICDIAERFFVNSAYLGQQFIKKKGISLNHYINTKRIQKSKELLLNTNFKIYEIAKKVGFDDPNYFSAKYYEYTNKTPSEFRKKGSFS